MKMKSFLCAVLLVLSAKMLSAQTFIGNEYATKLSFFEYYNHTTPEWVKLFRIKNYDANLGHWARAGVSGRLYFVDYQGLGGSYIDFSFPQSISSNLKPVLILNGSSAEQIEWHAFAGSNGPGQDYYDVYVKTPAHHLGLSFLIRGADYEAFFVKDNQPAGAALWNYQLNPESFSYYNGKGQLGLGTLSPQEKLSVNGNIRAKEVKVEIANWPDDVFDDKYVLTNLEALEKYILQHRHLPDVPDARTAERNGIELGEMNKILLKKVEELTLLLIQEKKERQKDVQRIETLVKKLENIK